MRERQGQDEMRKEREGAREGERGREGRGERWGEREGIHVHEYMYMYRIAGNFRGRKLYEFRDFSAIRRSFLHEILGMPHPLCDQF